MKAGKESYYIVSKFEHFEYAKVAPLFAHLSREFEGCVAGDAAPDSAPRRRTAHVGAFLIRLNLVARRCGRS